MDGTTGLTGAGVDSSRQPERGVAAKPPVKQRTGGVLPNKAAEDDPRTWGDSSSYDHDAWLKEQKPPHWG